MGSSTPLTVQAPRADSSTINFPYKTGMLTLLNFMPEATPRDGGITGFVKLYTGSAKGRPTSSAV